MILDILDEMCAENPAKCKCLECKNIRLKGAI